MTWLINSVWISLGATTVTIVTTTLASYSFARLRWPGRDVVFLILLSAMFIPWEISAIPLYFITVKLGLLNTYGGCFCPSRRCPSACSCCASSS